MFESITTIDNLRRAWLKALNHAQLEDVFFDHYGYQQFSSFLEPNLISLQHELVSGSYEPAPLRYTTIPKGERERKIYFTAPKDTVVIQAVMNVIGPLFEQQFSNACFGYRLNIGAEDGGMPYKRWQGSYNDYTTTVRSFLNQGTNAWYLIADIENFYPSINRNRLRGLIAQVVQEELTLRLLDQFLELQAFDLTENIVPVAGLPPGTIYAHFLANIYLMGFDQLAEEYSLGYARYVDDICLVFGNKNELEQGERVLLDYLGQWNQGFKGGKTERWPVTEWEVLIEHTQKMRYATRLDFVELLDLSEDDIESARDAEHYFKRVYKILDKGGGLERLVNEAASVLVQLHELEAANLDKLIYSLLESVPLKPSTLRIALSILLEIELSNPSDKFSNFFSQVSSEYIRISLLQILPFFAEHTAQLKPLLITKFANDSNYLIRANTYVALKQFADAGSIYLNNDELRDLREKESSIFAFHRLVECYAGVQSGEIWASLVSLFSDEPHVKTAAARVILKLLDTQRISPSAIDSFLPLFNQVDL